MRRGRERTMAERFLDAGAVEPERRRRFGGSTVRMIAAGLARVAGLIAAAAVIAGGAGLAYGALRGADLWRSLALGLYVGGALIIVFAVLSGARPVRYVGELGEDLGPGGGGLSESLVYVVVGVALIGLGIASESIH